MKRALSKLVYGAVFAIIMASCTKVVTKPTPVIPLYKSLEEYSGMTSSQRDSVIKVDSLPLSVMFGYLGISEHPDNAILERWSKSDVVKVFTPAVDSVFHNLDDIEMKLAHILESCNHDSLDIPHRHYAAVVWGNMRSIVMSDSCMLIALNHYLGKDFPGYSHLPEYMRATKNAEQIPFDICEALIANRYPYKHNEESTVLSRMLYEGAVIVAKTRLLPYSDPAKCMGYTDEQLTWLSNNRANIWKKLVAGNLLYSTSKADVESIVCPAPYTLPLGSDSPPRAGRYIGYTIVMSYLQNNSVTKLPQLLSPAFYDNPSILIEAAYE